MNLLLAGLIFSAAEAYPAGTEIVIENSRGGSTPLLTAPNVVLTPPVCTASKGSKAVVRASREGDWYLVEVAPGNGCDDVQGWLLGEHFSPVRSE